MYILLKGSTTAGLSDATDIACTIKIHINQTMVMVSLADTQDNYRCYTNKKYISLLHITAYTVYAHCPWRKHLFTPSWILFFHSSFYVLFHLVPLWRKVQATCTLCSFSNVCNRIQHQPSTVEALFYFIRQRGQKAKSTTAKPSVVCPLSTDVR